MYAWAKPEAQVGRCGRVVLLGGAYFMASVLRRSGTNW